MADRRTTTPDVDDVLAPEVRYTPPPVLPLLSDVPPAAISTDPEVEPNKGVEPTTTLKPPADPGTAVPVIRSTLPEGPEAVVPLLKLMAPEVDVEEAPLTTDIAPCAPSISQAQHTQLATWH